MNEFKREERYIVIKRSDFLPNGRKEKALRRFLSETAIPTRESVVVEPHHPHYEETWENVQRVVEERPTIGQERDALATSNANIARQHGEIQEALVSERDRADALAAYAEAGKHIVRGWGRGEFGDVAAALQLDQWARTKPATSLARRDARMRAEGGESALVQVAVEMRQNNDRGSKADLYGLARHLEECARACRRQAEEPTE